jgi:pantoate--beta-alanine ligase
MPPSGLQTQQMIIVKEQVVLKEYLNKQRLKGLTIGFIPTMGALHAGHIELINISSHHCNIIVCSIFVNPTQFNDRNDFNKYPATPESDIRLLESSPADVLYIPQVADVYSGGTMSLETYPIGPLESILEGRYRPGHFQGVCQVMQRLLNIVQPDELFMGQKDYQQCMVVDKLIGLLQLPVKLVRCPTLREPDGLAMSSRNLRLSTSNREKAPAIFETLAWIKENLVTGDTSSVVHKASKILVQKGFKAEYVALADARDLQPIITWDGKQPLVALIAAFLGDVRLIDNMVLS